MEIIKDINILCSLPLEILFHIVIKYLSYPQIVNLCRSSKDLYLKLSANPIFWQSFYLQSISSIPLLNINDYQSNYKKIFFNLKSLDLNTQLFYAAKNGYYHLVQDLVLKGADITSKK